MGEAFYEVWPDVRAHMEQLSATIDRDLAHLCFEASAETVTETENAQPALYGIGTAVYAGLIDRGLPEPVHVTGHSLGHYGAITSAGMMTPTDGISVVKRRGEAIASAANERSGTMVALLFVDTADIEGACQAREDVTVALYNGPEQTVISGSQTGIDAVVDQVGGRAHPIDVSAPFHSAAMAPAQAAVEEALDSVSMQEATVPVVSDVSGTPYTDPVTARAELTEQVTAPIDWVGTIETLKARGVSEYVVVPPAETVADLIERNDPEATVHALATPVDAEAILDG